MHPWLRKLGIGLLIVAGIAAYWAYAVGFTVDTQPGDERRTIRAALVAEYYGMPELAEGKSVIIRTRYLDGSYDVDSEFENESLAISTLYSVERKSSDALSVYGSTKVAMSLLETDGVVLQERDELFDWGDNSSSEVMVVDGEPVGHVIIARKGKAVFSTTIGGLYIEDPAELSALLMELTASAERDG